MNRSPSSLPASSSPSSKSPFTLSTPIHTRFFDPVSAMDNTACSRLAMLATAERQTAAGQSSWIVAKFAAPPPSLTTLRKILKLLTLPATELHGEPLSRVRECCTRALFDARVGSSWANAHPRHPLLRDHDHLLLPCRRDQAAPLRADLLATLRRASSPVRMPPRVWHLGSGVMHRWSGLFVSMAEGEVEFGVTPEAWRELQATLELAGPSQAGDVLGRWLAMVSPALMYLEFDFVRLKIADTLHMAGVDRPLDTSTLRDAWFKSIAMWLKVRDNIDL
jgi:hypothetical protein